MYVLCETRFLTISQSLIQNARSTTFLFRPERRLRLSYATHFSLPLVYVPSTIFLFTYILTNCRLTFFFFFVFEVFFRIEFKDVSQILYQPKVWFDRNFSILQCKKNLKKYLYWRCQGHLFCIIIMRTGIDKWAGK